MNEKEAQLQSTQTFVEITIPLLKHIDGQLPFDIYIKRTEVHFTKIFNVHDTIDWGRVRLYVDKGIRVFYVTNDQYLTYLQIIEKLTTSYINKSQNLSPDEAAALIREMINFAGMELTTKTEIETRTIKTAISVVMASIRTLEADPKSLIRVIKMLGQQSYLMRHSATTSILSIIFAKAVDFESDSVLGIIGLAAFLHDIGLIKLTCNTEDHETLTPEEWKEIKTHPEIGKRMLDSLPGIPSNVKMIILQHHEQPNGNGYPNNLRFHEIYMPAKLVAIADSFASLISERPYRPAHNAADALDLMAKDEGKFDKDMLKKFTAIFSRA